ncbi:MAG: hypothetical protein AMJ81_11525 [Phycisphaerae bacterium SM23_33]|nr:MAG: hypothetical protein AMJ81_11525 [Phycisphaerae bacterium SM23_33]
MPDGGPTGAIPLAQHLLAAAAGRLVAGLPALLLRQVWQDRAGPAQPGEPWLVKLCAQDVDDDDLVGPWLFNRDQPVEASMPISPTGSQASQQD